MSVGNRVIERELKPSSPLVQHFSGNPSTKYPRTFLTKAFTKTRCLLLLPLIILPIIVHVSLLRLRDGVDPLIHDNLYFHTGDVSKHNAMVISNITKCRNLGSLLNTSSPLGPKEETEAEVDGCGSVETTVVILASQWFKEAYEGRNTASEAMYAQSAISTLNSLGYAYVFTSSGLGNSTLDETINMWKLLKGNVRMVWADPEQVDACWDNSQCIKTESNDEGIEGWRMMSFAYGTEYVMFLCLHPQMSDTRAKHPLGAEWTLSPFQSNDNTLLSFSVEPSCRRLPPKTPHDRARRPQAYLFATQSTDLVADTFAWSVPYFKHLRQSLGIEIITGFQNDNETLLFELEKVGVKNVGLENKMDYYKTLSDSFVLIGAGSPSMSSSSWEALCLGVPVCLIIYHKESS